MNAIEKQNLYFLAIIPPQQICDEVTSFKEDFANRFQSKTALKVIPHITLKAPFKLPHVAHDDTVQWFQQMPVTVSSFMQELNGFNAFHNKRSPVVFVKPVMNVSLHQLQKQVLQSFRKAYPKEAIMNTELEFKPHMTIAYRDLMPQLFAEAWKEYRTKIYTAAFEVDRFHLLQHNGRMWNSIDAFSLL